MHTSKYFEHILLPSLQTEKTQYFWNLSLKQIFGIRLKPAKMRKQSLFNEYSLCYWQANGRHFYIVATLPKLEDKTFHWSVYSQTRT